MRTSACCREGEKNWREKEIKQLLVKKGLEAKGAVAAYRRHLSTF
jgi:hypothetical protein